MKTKETSTREKALTWWNSIKSKRKKQLLCQSYRFSVGLQGTSFHSLTGREIEEIWRKETAYIDPSDIEAAYKMQVKPNQKQFKEFNESLFKAYINKFDDEDKYEMLRLLAESFKLNFEFNNSFISIWNKSLE
jgi:hypothetical protein